VVNPSPSDRSLSQVQVQNVINYLVAFYDIHGRKKEVLFFYSAPDTTRDTYLKLLYELKPVTVGVRDKRYELNLSLSYRNVVKGD
jgi:uncharacterized protein YxeA